VETLRRQGPTFACEPISTRDGGVRIDPDGATSVPALRGWGGHRRTSWSQPHERNALTETWSSGKGRNSAARWVKNASRLSARKNVGGVSGLSVECSPRGQKQKSGDLKRRLRKTLWRTQGRQNRQGWKGLAIRRESRKKPVTCLSAMAQSDTPNVMLQLQREPRSSSSKPLSREKRAVVPTSGRTSRQDDERWRGHLLILFIVKGEMSFEPVSKKNSVKF